MRKVFLIIMMVFLNVQPVYAKSLKVNIPVITHQSIQVEALDGAPTPKQKQLKTSGNVTFVFHQKGTYKYRLSSHTDMTYQVSITVKGTKSLSASTLITRNGHVVKVCSFIDDEGVYAKTERLTDPTTWYSSIWLAVNVSVMFIMIVVIMSVYRHTRK